VSSRLLGDHLERDGAQGLCLLDTGTLPRTLASTTFAVSSLSHATMSWRPADPLAASLTLARP
jgi:hypothetical protein